MSTLVKSFMHGGEGGGVRLAYLTAHRVCSVRVGVVSAM